MTYICCDRYTMARDAGHGVASSSQVLMFPPWARRTTFFFFFLVNLTEVAFVHSLESFSLMAAGGSGGSGLDQPRRDEMRLWSLHFETDRVVERLRRGKQAA